jgi:hypothetical protein
MVCSSEKLVQRKKHPTVLVCFFKSNEDRHSWRVFFVAAILQQRWSKTTDQKSPMQRAPTNPGFVAARGERTMLLPSHKPKADDCRAQSCEDSQKSTVLPSIQCSSSPNLLVCKNRPEKTPLEILHAHPNVFLAHGREPMQQERDHSSRALVELDRQERASCMGMGMGICHITAGDGPSSWNGPPCWDCNFPSSVTLEASGIWHIFRNTCILCILCILIHTMYVNAR